MIQEREQRTYGTYDGKKEKLHDVMNNEDYRGSLKDAYYKGEKSFDKNRSDDKLLMRAKKPFFKKIERSLSLNFNGRVR